MGKHNKIEPKRISFLATTGGLFATVLVAAGLFATSQLVTGDKPHEKRPETTQIVPTRVPAGTTGTINTPVQTAQNGSQTGAKSNPTQNNSQGTTKSPRAVEPPGTGSPGPTVPPIPPVVPPVVIPPVDADVDLPGLLSVEVEADLDKGLDVDLDARVGSLLSAKVDVEPTALPTIVIDLPLLGE